jgi:lipopolysaccharide transport system ATP-binding protein
VWLNEGRMVEDGPAEQVVDHYLQKNTTSHLESRWDDPDTAPGDHRARLHLARVKVKNAEMDQITVSTPLEIEFEYWNRVPGAALNISIVLNTAEQICVLNTTSGSAPRPVGLIHQVVEIPGDFLNVGAYYVDFLVVQDSSRVLFRRNDVVSFDVAEGERRGHWFGRVPGVVKPKLVWRDGEPEDER